MTALIFLEVVSHGFDGVFAFGLREFAQDDVVHIHAEGIGHHDAVGEYIRQFLVDVVLIHCGSLGGPLIAFQQFRRFDADGFRQVLRRVESVPVTVRREFAYRLHGGFADHDPDSSCIGEKVSS